MAIELTAFEAFYRAKHQGRKLAWSPALGTAVLTARFPGAEAAQDRVKELSVSVFQAAVLLLFADGAERGYAEILEGVRMCAFSFFFFFWVVVRG